MTGKRIMLIEDTALHRKLYAAWLRAGGHVPIVVADERTAFAAVEEAMPDAVIVDIRLPTISGLEIIEGLKARARVCDIPLLALTVLDSPQDRAACLAAGADAYLAKPSHMQVFLQQIQRLLGDGGVPHPA
jgi:two-component system OmpR family response regulator